MMKIGSFYEIRSLIKTHTKPLKTEIVVRISWFVKETEQTYVFYDFACRKQNVISIKELQGE